MQNHFILRALESSKTTIRGLLTSDITETLNRSEAGVKIGNEDELDNCSTKKKARPSQTLW